MGAKHTKCCCCPPCMETTGSDCCQCFPKTLCATITPYGSDPCSTELDWDGSSYPGSVSCGDTFYDLFFYFERDDDGCFFKLRSDALGFPEGYEHRWEIGVDIDCLTLSGEVGELSFEPAVKVTPTNCTGCACLCECLCVTVRRYINGIRCTECHGKLCWYPDSESYIGDARCSATVSEAVEIKIGPKGLYCESEDTDGDGVLDPGEDTDGDGYLDVCDPYDETCVIVLDIPGMDIEGEWQELTAVCEGRNLDYSWVIERVTYEGDTERIEVDIECAICNEVCPAIGECPCCPPGTDFIQSVLSSIVMTVLDPGDVADCMPGGQTVFTANGLTWPCEIDYTEIGLDIEATLRCVEDGYNGSNYEFAIKGNLNVPPSPGEVERIGTITVEECAECPGDPITGITEGYFRIEGLTATCEVSGPVITTTRLLFEIFIEGECAPC